MSLQPTADECISLYVRGCMRNAYDILTLLPVSGTCVMQSGTSFCLVRDSGTR